jgi:polyisoprenoid-binding protein YceI
MEEVVYTICPSSESTVAVEVFRTGLMRKKRHALFFENFSGEMRFSGQDPSDFRVVLTIDATSIVCRDAWLSKRRRRAIAEFARKEALATDVHPEIHFSSTCTSAKALRGFLVEGALQIRGLTANVKVNLMVNPIRDGLFQLDGDALLRLTDLGLPRRSSMLGLIGTADEAVAHLLLWATPQARIS